MHPVQYTQRGCHTGPAVKPDPRVSRSRSRAVVDRPALAVGELAGGEVTTSGFPATRRTRCAKNGHWGSSKGSSAARMVEHRRGSLAVRRFRPWQGTGRSARGSRGQGGAHARERKEKGGAERGCPWEQSSPVSSATLRRAIAAGSSLTTSNGDEHRLRDVEAELWARWRGRRRAGTAGRVSSGEARRAVMKAGVRCGCCCC